MGGRVTKFRRRHQRAIGRDGSKRAQRGSRVALCEAAHDMVRVMVLHDDPTARGRHSPPSHDTREHGPRPLTLRKQRFQSAFADNSEIGSTHRLLIPRHGMKGKAVGRCYNTTPRCSPARSPDSLRAKMLQVVASVRACFGSGGSGIFPGSSSRGRTTRSTSAASDLYGVLRTGV